MHHRMRQQLAVACTARAKQPSHACLSALYPAVGRGTELHAVRSKCTVAACMPGPRMVLNLPAENALESLMVLQQQLASNPGAKLTLHSMYNAYVCLCAA